MMYSIPTKTFDSETFEYYAKRSDTDWFWVIDRDYEFNGKLLDMYQTSHETDYVSMCFKWGLEYRYLKSVTELWDHRVGGIYLVNRDFDWDNKAKTYTLTQNVP